MIPQLVKFERQAREFLIEQNREGLRRDLNHALDRLCRWDLDDESEQSTHQILNLLSKVRLGVGIGLLTQQDAERVNGLFQLVQLREELNAAIEREDYNAAAEIRDRIEKLESSAAEKWSPLKDDLEPRDDDPLGDNPFDQTDFDQGAFDDSNFPGSDDSSFGDADLDDTGFEDSGFDEGESE